MNLVRVTVWSLVLAVSVTWWVGADGAKAQAPEDLRVVEGRVVNGTAGAGPVSAASLTLHEESLTRHEDLETTTNQQGRFRFDGIVLSPDAVYGVSMTYQGALYGVDIDLSRGSPSPVELTVFDAVYDLTSLRVTNSSLLVTQADRASQSLEVLEIATLENTMGDRTFVPGFETMSFLRFGLPAGAHGLRVDTSLLDANVLQVDRGFALTASVPPGEHNVAFTYIVPYSGGETTLTRSFPLGAKTARVLVVPEIARLSSQELGDPEAVLIGDRSYQLLTATDVSPGPVSVHLTGLAQAGFRDKLSQRMADIRLEYAAPAALGVLMTTLIVFALWWRATYRRKLSSQIDGAAALEGERSRLIRQVAELDVGFEEGAVDEERYRRQREELESRLAALTRHRLASSE